MPAVVSHYTASPEGALHHSYSYDAVVVWKGKLVEV